MTAVALSLEGSVMSTTEVKLPEDGIGGLVSLKFWASEPDSKTFTLSTIVYEPHRLITHPLLMDKALFFIITQFSCHLSFLVNLANLDFDFTDLFYKLLYPLQRVNFLLLYILQGCPCLSHCVPPYPLHGSEYIIRWRLQGSS